MSKTRIIAWREYMSAVRTKGFIVGIVLMPLLMGGGLILQRLTQGIVDLSPRVCDVIDQTPGQQLLPLLQQAAEHYNAEQTFDSSRHLRSRPPFRFDRIDVESGSDALDHARMKTAEDIRQGRAIAVLEIGPNVMMPIKPRNPADGDRAIYYSSNRPTYADLRDFIERTLQPHVLAAKLQQSRETIAAVTDSVPVILTRGLPSLDASGKVTFESKENQLVQVFLPLVMVVVMLVVVLVGASPLTTNIIEEKQLRIAEVLLGSVMPFQLMMGKLIGGVATSLSLGAIYVAGAVFAAWRLDVLHLVSPVLVVWFVIFTVIASLMYGSLFVVAGAAATNIKEAQALVTPLMLVVVMPMFLVGPLLNEPHGVVGLVGTFFPTSAPIVTMMRLSIPPAIPWWQPMGAIVSSSLLTAVLVWVAGRVFRAGFLLTGRPASIKEIVGWLIRR